MNSFVVCPEEGGPHPVVLFYMDAPGKREELHDMARRIAAVGYYVEVAGGTPHRIEWYPGTEHGFVFPQRTGIYHQAAAERHWERLFDLFRRTLQLSS